MNLKNIAQNGIFSFFKHRELIWEMTKREVKISNKGSALGHLWIVISPFFQTLTYVFIVTFVFNKSLDTGGSRMSYALLVLSGMIPWQIITRTIQMAPGMIRDRLEMVKQVVYPIETLPLTILITGSLGAIGALLVFTLLAAFYQELHFTFLLLPIPLFVISVFLIGLTWILSIFGVILRDLREIISLLFGILVYISPVVVTEALVGPKIWTVVMLNPFSHFIIIFRDALYGTFHVNSWIATCLMSACTYLIGAIVVTHSKQMIREYI